LSGPLLEAGELGTLPSEPMCPGAMQVATGGQPIVLMPDGPTVGGYPVIAVVCSADLGALAQRQPGDEVRFVELSLDDAYRSVRRLDAGLDALNRLGPGGGS
jgi:allophanate hydrolase subunit 2